MGKSRVRTAVLIALKLFELLLIGAHDLAIDVQANTAY